MDLKIAPALRRFITFNCLLLSPLGVLLAIDLNQPGAAQTPSENSTKQPVAVKPSAAELQQAYDRAFQFTSKVKNSVFQIRVLANWRPDNTRFWYRNDLRGGSKEFILIDAARGTRQPAFDHKHLAEALSKASGKTYQADKLPFDKIAFVDNDKAIQFELGGKTWKCSITYTVVPVDTKKAPTGNKETKPEAQDRQPEDTWDFSDELERDPWLLQQKKKKGGFKKRDPRASVKSPDGLWTAMVKDHNAVLLDKDGKEHPLTKDGKAENYYGYFGWSKDSKTLISFRTQPTEALKLHILDSSKKEVTRPRVIEIPYRVPGDKVDAHELWLFNIETKSPTRVETGPFDFGVPILHWLKDNPHLYLLRPSRDHKQTRLQEVNLGTGKTREVIDEKADKRIVRAKVYLHFVNDSIKEILWASERDGWNHLYLVNGQTGQAKQITRGNWVVRGVERVDDAARQIWFTASGRHPGQDPHQIHYYRVNFDGTGLTALTEGDGQHFITYSPDKKYLIDTYFRPDHAPVTELRRVADGSLICVLEKADTTALKAIGWRWPEVFHAKARDGKTDIWGVVYRPSNFDPAKKYPIIEYIYAGPWTASAPKIFSAANTVQALAELGFIVVQLDGMGLPGRSREFHDVSHQNHADAGLPDRILWIKSLAKRYPYIDLNRVGIYGHSGGGYSSTRALLDYPDFYKVAVSSSGNHVPGGYNLGYSEQWLGLMGAHYAAQSNATDAHKLKGKLFLLHGESDTNVINSLTTMKVVDALIKAGKDFDLLIIPGANHALGGGYITRRRYDFFVRHLLGVEPPDRNANPMALPKEKE